METEFNPEDYDQKMDKMFSDKYYAGDENEKPVFDDDIDTAAYENSDDDKSDNEAEGAGTNDEGAEAYEEEAYPPEYEEGYDESGGYYDENGDGYYGGEEGEEDILMDADYMPGGENFGKAPKKETKKERLKREKEEKKLAKMAEKGGKARTAVEALEAAKSLLDDDKKKDFNEYLDEYYQLDYEDMVGDLPTRFKYSRVKPSTFGLTPVEILLADDKDLNEFVSLKKFATYRAPEEQMHDIQKYSKKNRVQMFRHKLKTQIKDQDLDKNWDPVRLRKKMVEERDRKLAEAEKKPNGGESSSGTGAEEKKKKKKKSSKDKKRKAEDESDAADGAKEKKKSKKVKASEDEPARKRKSGDAEGKEADGEKKKEKHKEHKKKDKKKKGKKKAE